MADAFTVLASLCLPKIFLIQHDCGHGSFFKSKWANDVMGSLCGILSLTPYYYWRKTHAIHHASTGNLERRGIGDVVTLTVSEYRERTRWGRLTYRLYRNPVVIFLIGPMYLFFIQFRLPLSESRDWPRERASVWFTNVGASAVAVGLYAAFGTTGLLVAFLIAAMAAPVAVWLVYVQHQFEDAYWASDEDWDFESAALKGSTYYKLPAVLQWITTNIGFHHVHHLSPRIPNYRLQACHEANPALQQVPVLTLGSSFRTIFLKLWDEEQNKLVSFREATRSG